MAAMIQVDFFQTVEECRLDSMDKKVESLEVLVHKLRKSNYANINEFKKCVDDVSKRLEFIEKFICEAR